MINNTIHTVLGEIKPEDISNILTHEHIICCCDAMKLQFGNKWFDTDKVIEAATKLLSQARKECNINTIIDVTPINLGRNIEILKKVSDKSGVNIVVSTGLYHTEENFINGKSEEYLSELFIEECRNGILDSGIKPQMIKCATGSEGITRHNNKMLGIFSTVQRETGLPLYAHCVHSTLSATKQLEIFRQNGADIKRVVIGHCSDSYNMEYLLEIAESGCYMGFDRIYPQSYKEQALVIKNVIDRGFEDIILLSHDYFGFSDSVNMSWNEFEANPQRNGRDYTTVHKKLIPELKRLGVSEEALNKIILKNPLDLLFDRRA